MGADEKVEHLGAHQARVEHVHPLLEQTLAIACGQLGSVQAHVVAESHAQPIHWLAGEPA